MLVIQYILTGGHMFRIVKSFKNKDDVFPSNMYLFYEDYYICEIKDTTLFNGELLNEARYINQFMDSMNFVAED